VHDISDLETKYHCGERLVHIGEETSGEYLIHNGFMKINLAAFAMLVKNSNFYLLLIG